METSHSRPGPETVERYANPSASSTLHVDEQFKLLRPSKELLYYRRKMLQMSKEFQEMVEKVERCKTDSDKHHQLEQELQKRQSEITCLQGAVSDLQVHLYQEREQVLRLYAENDRLKVRGLQDRKKINYLLSLTSTTEKELNLICSRPWRTVVSQKGTKAFANKSVSARAKIPTLTSEKSSDPVDVDTLMLQTQALSSQLAEQTKLFEDNYQTLLKDRELQRQEASTHFERYQQKISILTSELKEARMKLCDTVKEMLSIKEKHVRSEQIWETEREMLTKSVLKHDISLFDHSIKGDGHSNREARSTSCELRLLKDELSQRDQLINMYQEQSHLLHEQVSSLKKEAEVHKVQYKDRIQKLQQLVTVLKGKYNQLDQRRRLESEGFRTDVRLLRTRLQEIERKLVKLNRSTSVNRLNLYQDVFISAADMASKAKRLGQELQSIKKKVAEMDNKLEC